MAAIPGTPDDDTLGGFLLGTLPVEQAERVYGWIEADATHVHRLERLRFRDALTDAIGDCALEDPVQAPAIERVVRWTVAALAEPPPDWPPSRLGGYRVVRELGHGGMGYVFEAEDEKLPRRVAVKVLKPDRVRKADATARFLREARAVAAIEHENVVPLLHVGEEAGMPYIIMPLLKGETLAARLKRERRLPIGDIVRIGRDVASGLAAAHEQGLIHRDIKPANIWLDAGTGRARVLDFGLARHDDTADSLSEAGTLMGTPAYMAPEQIDGQPASVRSDLFSLGAVLYECATGHRAFDGPTITAILKAVSTHHPTAPSELNPELPAAISGLILQLLAKEPAERPATAEKVVDALAGSRDLSTDVWLNRAARTNPKRRRFAEFAIGAFLVALLAVGL